MSSQPPLLEHIAQISNSSAQMSAVDADDVKNAEALFAITLETKYKSHISPAVVDIARDYYVKILRIAAMGFVDFENIGVVANVAAKAFERDVGKFFDKPANVQATPVNRLQNKFKSNVPAVIDPWEADHLKELEKSFESAIKAHLTKATPYAELLSVKQDYTKALKVALHLNLPLVSPFNADRRANRFEAHVRKANILNLTLPQGDAVLAKMQA